VDKYVPWPGTNVCLAQFFQLSGTFPTGTTLTHVKAKNLRRINMTDQQFETQISSQDVAAGKLGSTLQAHMIGVGAVAAAIGLSWLFDLDMQGKTAYSLFLAAIVIYAGFYNESTKDKSDH
jgi:hypothetical protein